MTTPANLTPTRTACRACGGLGYGMAAGPCKACGGSCHDGTPPGRFRGPVPAAQPGRAPARRARRVAP